MGLETTIFTFKIFVQFEDWARSFDSEGLGLMHRNSSVTPIYRGISKEDPKLVVVIHQVEECFAKAMFESFRAPIEASGHIWDSTVITSYLAD